MKLELAKATPGWFHPKELHRLVTTARRLPVNANLVEVGVWRGRSTAAVLQAIEGSPRRLFSIDHFIGSKEHNLRGRSTFLGYTDTVTAHGPSRCFQLACDQTAAAEHLSGLPVHWLLLDGPHDYAGVRAGVQAFWPLLVPDALVLFHDRGHWDGVDQVLRELLEHGSLVPRRQVRSLASGRVRVHRGLPWD